MPVVSSSSSSSGSPEPTRAEFEQEFGENQQPDADVATRGRQISNPEFSCLRCEAKGMRCGFTKFAVGQDLDPMCARCVRAGAKFCIKQRLPRPGFGEGRTMYIDPRIGDGDYDREEVLAMIDDFWQGPQKYTFGGTPIRARDVDGWALPAHPKADRFSRFDKLEEKADADGEVEPEPATPTKEESAAAARPSKEKLRKQREERRKKLTPRERNVEDWAESAAQSWGKVLPARINKSKTQIPILQQTVAAKRAQHDLEWDALCAEFEAHDLQPPSPEEKPELETAESAVLRAKLKHYQMRRTHLTEVLDAKRLATKR